jgi:hypothetical protein
METLAISWRVMWTSRGKFGSQVLKRMLGAGLIVQLTLVACNEKPSINKGNDVTNDPGSGNVRPGWEDPEEEFINGPPKPTTSTGTKTTTTGSTGEFDICKNALKSDPALSGFRAQVGILCDEGKLNFVISPTSIYIGTDRKLYELGKRIGDTETTFKIYSGGAYDSKPEDYWNLLKLQFVKPKVFKENYLADPNAKMDQVIPTDGEVTYRYSNNSGEGGAIEYDAKTVFITLKPGKAWVAVTQKIGPTRETMESLQSLQIVFDSDKYPGKTLLVSISDQIYKHASGQGQSYYDRAMNNLTTEQKNGFTNATTSSKAKGLLGP